MHGASQRVYIKVSFKMTFTRLHKNFGGGIGDGCYNSFMYMYVNDYRMYTVGN